MGSGAGGSTHTEFTLEGLATWQPDIWGTIRRQIESRKAGVQVSEANLANAELSAQATLATDYFDLRAADSLRALLERAVTLDQRALEITRNQFQSGTATNGDLASAQASLEATQAQLVAVEQQRGTYEHAIAVLTRSPAVGAERSGGATRGEGAAGPGVRAVGASRAQPEHCGRRAADAAGERAHRRGDRGVLSDHQSAGLGGYAGNPLSTLINAGNRIWSTAGTASDVLFQGGEQVAAVAQARATYDQYVASYRQTVLSTFQSVEDQLLALRVLERSAEFERRAVEHAQLAADVALNQFNAGTVSYTTVITDIQALIADQESLLTMQQNELVADVSLIESLGGGWDVSRL